MAKTIDSRLGALTQSVELLALMHKDNEQRMKRLDKGERQARKALLAGITSYLRALNGGKE